MIEETLVRCKARQERWYLPELTRIKGELILKEARHAPSAEACFREALEIAAQQRACFWELRSAISLARFRIARGRNAEAAETLRKVYGSFSEGLDIADMRTARGLLDGLRT